MKKTVRMLLLLLVGFLFLTNNVYASEKDLDWTQPIRVRLLSYDNNNLFTVQAENESFQVSMFGVDIVEKYTVTKVRNNGVTTEEYDEKFIEQNIFNDLLHQNTLVLELDSLDNKYNKDGIIQAWFWSNGELFQGKLISEGRAKLDSDICKYSTCEKYYKVLALDQEFAQKQLLGVWGETKQVQYLENVGGNEMKFNFTMETLAYTMIGVAGVLLLIIIILLVTGKKKKNKGKNEKVEVVKTSEEPKEEIKTTTQDVKETVTKQVSSIGEPIKRTVEENTEATKENIVATQNAVQSVIEKTDNINAIIHDTAANEARIDEIVNLMDKEVVNRVDQMVAEPIYAPQPESSVETNDVIETIEQITESPIAENVVEPSFNKLKPIVPEISSVFDVLLSVKNTTFEPGDVRNKEAAEVINIEYMIIDDKFNKKVKNIFVHPMRNQELTNICMTQTGITQEQVNNGVLLEEAVKELLKDIEGCRHIYIWGKASTIALEADSESKLFPEDLAKVKAISETAINYKNEFAKRQEITPCGLPHAIEMFGLPKSDSLVEMMGSLYKAERE